jgi:hypothetical protein
VEHVVNRVDENAAAAREALRPKAGDLGPLLDERQSSMVSQAYATVVASNSPAAVVYRHADEYYPGGLELDADGVVWVATRNDRWPVGTARRDADGTTLVWWNRAGVDEPQYRRDRWKSYLNVGTKHLPQRGAKDC